MSDPLADGLDVALEVVEAARNLIHRAIRELHNDVPSEITDEWAKLVKVVAAYERLADPDAAKRNRDEHGPDIPTEGLDWRDKL